MEASEVIFKSMVEGELTRRVVMGKFRGPFQAPGADSADGMSNCGSCRQLRIPCHTKHAAALNFLQAG